MEREQNTDHPVKVFLADDHTLFRKGLAGLLGAYGGLEIIAEVPNDGAALTLVQEHKPDVVVMQVQMPFERSKKSLLKMREISPQPKAVIVTMFEDPRYLRELMNLGASAYLIMRWLRVSEIVLGWPSRTFSLSIKMPQAVARSFASLPLLTSLASSRTFSMNWPVYSMRLSRLRSIRRSIASMGVRWIGVRPRRLA
jgi:DNA-binding NarL/FixJ family response regulator